MPEETNVIHNMLATGEVARLFRVSTGTVRRWSDQGKLKAYRIGPRGARRFLRRDIAFFSAGANEHGRHTSG